MIMRIWRGITPKEQADAYLEHLQQTALPALKDFKGQRGAWVLRRVQGEQCEFQVLTLWDSMKALHAYAGKQPERDIAIEYTGLRPGEKLHETLFHADERYSATTYPNILQAAARSVVPERVEHALEVLRGAVRDYDLERLADALRDAVPEFNPSDDTEVAHVATVVAFPARRARQPQ